MADNGEHYADERCVFQRLRVLFCGAHERLQLLRRVKFAAQLKMLARTTGSEKARMIQSAALDV